MAKFTFIDLFAGIGGLRIGFDKLGGGCVFSSEIDKFARQYVGNDHSYTATNEPIFSVGLTKGND